MENLNNRVILNRKKIDFINFVFDNYKDLSDNQKIRVIHSLINLIDDNTLGSPSIKKACNIIRELCCSIEDKNIIEKNELDEFKRKVFNIQKHKICPMSSII